jgi:hypothetical protein
LVIIKATLEMSNVVVMNYLFLWHKFYHMPKVTRHLICSVQLIHIKIYFPLNPSSGYFSYMLWFPQLNKIKFKAWTGPL